MSAGNGVLRIGRKGKKKFAFGEEGAPGECVFEVDVVETFQGWIDVDESFRAEDRSVPDTKAYQTAAVGFVKKVSGAADLTTAEALDFLARLREVYDDLAAFFHARSPEERGSPGTSGAVPPGISARMEMQFSDDGA